MLVRKLLLPVEKGIYWCDGNEDEAMNVYLNGCKRDFEEYKILVDKYKIHRRCSW